MSDHMIKPAFLKAQVAKAKARRRIPPFLRRLIAPSAALVAAYGRNDWHVALLRKLAADPAFCAAPVRYLGPPPPA